MDGDEDAPTGGDLPGQDGPLLVSPREQLDRRLRAGGDDAESFDEPSSEPVERLLVQDRASGQGGTAVSFHRQVVGDGEVGHQAHPQPVTGDVADAGLDGLAGGAVGDLPTVDADVAPGGRSQSGDHLGQLPLPVAGDTGDPQDLPLVDGEGDAPQRGQPLVVQRLQLLHLQDYPAGPAGLLAQVEEDFPSDHQPGQFRLGGLLGGEGGDDAAGPQHRHPVGEGHHLVQLVGDEDDRLTFVGHLTQRGRQVGCLLGRQDRCGLVQDQHVGPPVEELQDLHPLLLPDGELPDVGIGVHGQAVAGGEGGQLLAHLLQVQDEAGGVETQDDVLGHGEAFDQHKVLVDHTDAVSDGVPRGAQVDGPAVDDDLALVGPVEAGEDVHQGALAGPVFPQQGQHLAGVDIQVHVVVGQDAGKPFGDPPHLDGRKVRRIRAHCSYPSADAIKALQASSTSCALARASRASSRV